MSSEKQNEIRVGNYKTLEQHMETMAAMRAEGRPIDSPEEYREFVRSGCDYSAVERMRAQRTCDAPVNLM